MKSLLESLKKGGKRSEAEAEFQFMLYFYNLIDNKKYYIRLSDKELELFNNYVDSIPLDILKNDLKDLFKSNEIGKLIFEQNQNFENLSIVSDFASFAKTYPNINNIKNSFIYSTNNNSKTFLEFQNILFNLNNKIYDAHDLQNNKKEELFKEINNKEHLIVSIDFMIGVDNNLFNFFQNLNFNNLFKEKNLVLIGDYTNLKVDKAYLIAEKNGLLIFNYNKESNFEESIIKSIPYNFISKFPTYSFLYNEKLSDTILKIICDKYKITNKKENIETYINCVYEKYKEIFDKDILEYKENKILELEKIKNEIDLIDDFYSNKKFEISDFE